MTLTIETLTPMRALCSVKARLHRQMAALQSPECDRETAVAAIIQLFVTEYQPLLDDLSSSTDPATLASQLASITTRLDKGWNVEGSKADALFKRLVLELEVLSDLMATGHTDGGQTPLAVFLDRIARWEQAV